MAVTAPKPTIPTVSQAVEFFMASRSRQDWRSLASVLQGPPTGHVTGRKAAGSALARSDLGPLRFDRVTSAQFVAWLHQRHPADLSQSSLRRGSSALRQLLKYAAAHGWADDHLADAVPTVKPSPPRRDWLRPEQVVALADLIFAPPSDDVEPYEPEPTALFTHTQRMMWHTAINTGARVSELIALKPEALNTIDCTVTIIGKGQKRRDVPVSHYFRSDWQEYVLSHSLRPDSWLFPLEAVRFTNAEYHAQVERVVIDQRRHCDAKAVRAMCQRLYAAAVEAVQRGRIEADLLPSRMITPHTLRRTFATNQLIAAEVIGRGNGMDLRTLQLALGQESLETTSLYLSDVSHYVQRHRHPMSVADAASVIVDLNEIGDDRIDLVPGFPR